MSGRGSSRTAYFRSRTSVPYASISIPRSKANAQGHHAPAGGGTQDTSASTPTCQGQSAGLEHKPLRQQRPLLPQHILQPRRPRGTFSGPFRAVRLGLLECFSGGVQRLPRLLRLLRPQVLGLAQPFLGLLQFFLGRSEPCTKVFGGGGNFLRARLEGSEFLGVKGIRRGARSDWGSAASDRSAAQCRADSRAIPWRYDKYLDAFR